MGCRTLLLLHFAVTVKTGKQKKLKICKVFDLLVSSLCDFFFFFVFLSYGRYSIEYKLQCLSISWMVFQWRCSSARRRTSERDNDTQRAKSTHFMMKCRCVWATNTNQHSAFVPQMVKKHKQTKHHGSMIHNAMFMHHYNGMQTEVSNCPLAEAVPFVLVCACKSIFDST